MSPGLRMLVAGKSHGWLRRFCFNLDVKDVVLMGISKDGRVINYFLRRDLFNGTNFKTECAAASRLTFYNNTSTLRFNEFL